MRRLLVLAGATTLALAALLAWANRPYAGRRARPSRRDDPGGLIMIHGLHPLLSFFGRLHRGSRPRAPA